MTSNDKQLAELLKTEGIKDDNVLKAIAAVSRQAFMREDLRSYAYADEALPIKCGQTISQPFVVARMTELVLNGKKRLKNVLEIGTGSGYQAAVLSHLADDVYSVERIKTLYDEASQLFTQLKLGNIHTLYGDGHMGWTEHSPFEAIIVTAAVADVPQQLLLQLDRNGGRMIIPVGAQGGWQELQVIERNQQDYSVESLDSVAFVPMLPGLQNNP